MIGLLNKGACYPKSNCEYAKQLESSIKEKDEQILAMRNCSNCQHYTSDKCSVCRFVSSTFTGDFIDNWKMKTRG